MSKIEKLSIALTPELAAMVRDAVGRGEYASTSEVVREAIRAWAHKRDDRAATIAHYRRLWEEGLASGDAQDRPPLEEFLKAARSRMARGRAA